MLYVCTFKFFEMLRCRKWLNPMRDVMQKKIGIIEGFKRIYIQAITNIFLVCFSF